MTSPMDSPVATTSSTPQTDARPLPAQHQYGTRIRQNIVIKPSARLRQSPDPPPQPRKIKPILPLKPSSVDSTSPNNFPQFPPPHIVLHPDDANSKVFLAIGRSFLSVDNRAMTIKDLAEMTVNFGLVCQNVSAASQAITTYIRTHMQRCDTQQDHPLLLRHVLSGTASDDDLLPALHSRSGGAHCTINAESRTTNFRRGTMVWYLSRATGAPCPFTRAGIRLCEYGENGKVGLHNAIKEKKRHTDRQRRADQCGQKRKRPLRGCVGRGSDSDSTNEDGKPPPKVKLTLRLKPFPPKSPSSSTDPSSVSRRVIDLSMDSDSDDSRDDSMSVDSSEDEANLPEQQPVEEPWSLPPYPRRSISIPCYTPSYDGPYPYFPLASVDQSNDFYRRSPSVSYSVASPPPDSEDDDDDYHITMTGARRYSAADRLRTPATADADFECDADFDSEGDGETLWESPGPRSPSAPLMHGTTEVAVKQETRDVQGMLDAWEDFDCSAADAKVVEVIAQAAASVLEVESTSNVKVEALDSWDWEAGYKTADPKWYSPALGEEEGPANIKQEDMEFNPLMSSSSYQHGRQPIAIPAASSPISPLSSLSSRFSSLSHSESPMADSLFRNSELTWADVELLGPDSIHQQEFEGEWRDGGKQFATVRPRAKTAPSITPFFTKPTPTSFTSPQAPQREMLEASSIATLVQPEPAPISSISQSLSSLIQSIATNSQNSVSPSSLWLQPPCISPHETRCDGTGYADVVVVHTCQPCTPAISATQVEGISVYQMMLGSSSLLRRIDTDFVNLSPIVSFSGAPYPILSTIPNATVISKGSPAVSGTWVPLSAAQAYVRDHPLPGGLLDVFLSDVLFERFPSALQDFHRSSTPGRMLNQFGPHFGSTLQATHLSVQTDIPFGPGCNSGAPWEMKQGLGGWTQDEQLLPINLPFVLPQPMSTEIDVDVVETPLSATEQEMFHALCSIPDWDKESPVSPSVILAGEGPRNAEEPRVDSVPEPTQPEQSSDRARPLRRSKRVADAIAAQSSTRSRRRGSRNSLS